MTRDGSYHAGSIVLPTDQWKSESTMDNVQNVKQNEVLEPETNHKQDNDIENKEHSTTDSIKKENVMKISEKENQKENHGEPIPDPKKQKRQNLRKL